MQVLSVLFVAGVLALPWPATAQVIGDSRAPPSVGAGPPRSTSRPVQAEPAHPTFGGQAASPDVHRLADWVAATGDNRELPFIIVDKQDAKVFLFEARGRILGVAPALLGVARGDDTVTGIGQRRLATMAPGERTTPAGRFEAALGNDLDQDVLWIDYDAALSLHRVIVGNPSDRRHERLVSATPLDNRISYGCINVPARFYDDMVVPAFRGTVGIVYILPETRALEAVFAIGGEPAQPPRTGR